METDPDGAKKPITINVIPFFLWLWRKDRVQKVVRKLKRK